MWSAGHVGTCGVPGVFPLPAKLKQRKVITFTWVQQ